MDITQEWKERIFSLEAENERLNAINCEYIRELSRLNDESNSLNGSLSRWKENRQAVHDREIVMGEKIKLLKAIAKECDPYEPADAFVLLDKIENL